MLGALLAVVPALSAASFASTAAWADRDDGPKRPHDRIIALEKHEQRAAAKAPFGSAKISAEGLAVEKSNRMAETADATVVLTVTAYKNPGNNHVRMATTTTCAQTARSGPTT